MILRSITDLRHDKEPLVLADLPVPVPAGNEVLVKILACGVCHTELDEIEGRTPPSKFPMIPGHQAVGRVVEAPRVKSDIKPGDRVAAGDRRTRLPD